MFDTDSIANRLALIFFAITLGAMAIVYVGVVPRLESSLVDERAALLQADGERLGASINSGISRGEPVTTIDREVRDAADRANARVTLIGAPASTGGEPFVKSDSNRRADIGELRFPAALATIASGKVETATESLGSERFVETAIPLYSTNAETGRRVLSNVLVLSSPLNDVEKNVTLVRDRILLATVIALIAALLAGYLVARAFGRRVGRLEQTARRVAAGDFSARFVVDGDDELGRLAGALDEMQGQLAELESARRRFIATASHELRTPIFSLGGFVELLEDEDLDEETRDRFLAQLAALAGAGWQGQGQAGAGLAFENLAYFAAQLRSRVVPAHLIAGVLAEYLQVPVTVEQFAGKWDALGPRDRSRLGENNCDVGLGATETGHGRGGHVRAGSPAPSRGRRSTRPCRPGRKG